MKSGLAKWKGIEDSTKNFVEGLDNIFEMIGANGAEITIDSDTWRISSKGPVAKDMLPATLRALGAVHGGLVIGVPGYEEHSQPPFADKGLEPPVEPPVVRMSKDGRLFIEISEEQFEGYKKDRQIRGSSNLHILKSRYDFDGREVMQEITEELERTNPASAARVRRKLDEMNRDELAGVGASGAAAKKSIDPRVVAAAATTRLSKHY